MLVVETIAKIRRAHFIDGKSIKQICRELRLSRNTVRKVIRSGATEFISDRTTQPRPKIDPWRPQLDEMLAENARHPKRVRLTLVRIYEELRNLGFDGSYDAVRRYAASWSKATREASADAYVPLSFDPGEAYQFDWSHEVVLIDGATTTVKVAHVRLCHSRMPFVRAYPRETLEMVFDAHDRAFAFFGGACARGIYDNMKTAVDAILVGKDRVYNRRFQQMCGHYLVDPVACTPASGWEKGQVENQVGVLRRRFFVPRPKFKSYAELNDETLSAIGPRTMVECWRIVAWPTLGPIRIRRCGTDRSGRCSTRNARALCPMSVRLMGSMRYRPPSPRPAWCASTITATRWMPALLDGRSRSEPMPIASNAGKPDRLSVATCGPSGAAGRSMIPFTISLF